MERWENYMRINNDMKGKANNFLRLYEVYKKGAINRKLSFNLNIDQFKELIKQNCFYCGMSPSNSTRGSEKSRLIYNGIDRIENKKGYEINNVVPCCKTCNFMKVKLNYQDFLLQAVRIAKNHDIEFISLNIKKYSQEFLANHFRELEKSLVVYKIESDFLVNAPLDTMIKKRIEEALNKANKNRTKAAQLLGITRSRMRIFMKNYHLI